MRKGYLLHRRPAKAQASMRISTVLLDVAVRCRDIEEASDKNARL